MFAKKLLIVSFIMAILMENCQSDLGFGNLINDLVPSFKKIYPLRQFGPKAKIDPNSITMSGISSGAFMAMQFHLAHSDIIKGVGMVAGGPYARAYGYPVVGTNAFTGGLNFIVFNLFPTFKTVPELVDQARTFEANGYIDPLANINGSKVLVYHGGLDSLVQSIEGTRAAEMYGMLGADVKDVPMANGEHGMPTDNYGGPCETIDFVHDGVNNCQYEVVFDMFAKFYPNFIRPASTSSPRPAGSYYYVFDQTPFVPAAFASSRAYMAQAGYVYIPPGCQAEGATCRLHLALHGCWQSIYTDFQLVENQFATRTGYTQVADANNITIIFPQAAPLYVDPTNSNLACWDFIGGTTPDFPFKSAPQIQTLYNMIANLAGFSAIP